jgi:hypothetical protein
MRNLNHPAVQRTAGRVIIRLERVLGSVEENKRDFYFESFKKVNQIELKEQVVHVFFIITALSASHLYSLLFLFFFLVVVVGFFHHHHRRRVIMLLLLEKLEEECWNKY